MTYHFPAPTGRDYRNDGAWWRLSCGSALWARPGEVLADGLDRRSLDELEGDALAVLAACAWARGAG